MVYQTELTKILSEYEQERADIIARSDEEKIVEAVREYEQKLRAEYAAEKEKQLKDIDISIEAVKRVKERFEKAASDELAILRQNDEKLNNLGGM